eukprot:COSAG01_NODE_1099_length_11701_cov_8.251508_13_plen_92_part_00
MRPGPALRASDDLPAMVTGAVAEMPSALPPAVRGIGPHLASCHRPARGSWYAATHRAPSRAVRGNVSQAPHRVLGRSTRYRTRMYGRTRSI